MISPTMSTQPIELNIEIIRGPSRLISLFRPCSAACQERPRFARSFPSSVWD